MSYTCISCLFYLNKLFFTIKNNLLERFFKLIPKFLRLFDKQVHLPPEFPHHHHVIIETNPTKFRGNQQKPNVLLNLSVVSIILNWADNEKGAI